VKGRVMSVTKGLSYVFPIGLQRLSCCPPSWLWRATVAVGSVKQRLYTPTDKQAREEMAIS